MKPHKTVVLATALCTMMIITKVFAGPQANTIQKSSPVLLKGASAKFDLNRMEQQGKILKKIQKGHSIANSIEQARKSAEQVRGRKFAIKASTLKKAKIFGKTTRFLEAPSSFRRASPANVNSATSSNVLVNGNTRDSLFVGDPLTLTFSFAPGAVSAVLSILVDANGNGVADSSDIPITDMLLLDNDDNDGISANGSYELRIDAQDFITFFIAPLIFEVNDYQAVSSAIAVVRQKPTSSLVLGSVTPPFPRLAFSISGLAAPAYVFSDTSGRFSFYVDRSMVNSVTVSQPIDVVDVSGGYVPPEGQTKVISSDTTIVSLVFSPATSFVEGYVRDQTGVGIAKATIYTMSESSYKRTRTDLNGYYKAGVVAGTCYVGASPPQASEYLTTSASLQYLNVPSNTTVQRDFSLIHANSTISGKVTLAGQGVAGIPISAYSDTLSNSVLSSVNGAYTMPVYNASGGTLKYTVSAYVTNGLYISFPDRSNIQPGAVGVDFAILRIAGGIQGRITDQSTGLPIANASVWASGSSYKSTVSNDSGYYRMSLLDGAYYLTVDANRYYEYSESNISVAGAIVTRNVSLLKSGSISGTTKDIDGNPIPNAAIYASDSTGYYSGYAYSDANGRYVLSGLRTSRYKVQCSRSGYMSEWFDNVTDWQNASLVQVNDGFDTPNINFTLSRGGSISGYVTDKSGKPIASVEIDVYDSTYNMRSYALTNDSGYYFASGLGSGRYYVATNSYDYFSQWYDGADSYFNATPVSVMIDQNTPSINFTLSKGASISGRVTTKAGVPIPYASIYAEALVDSVFGLYAYSSTNDSGSYVITRLMPGKKYYVAATANGYATRWYDNVSNISSATAIVLQDEEARTNIDFTLPLAGSVSGRVWDDAGHPLPYAYVYVIDSLGSYSGYGYADQQGAYLVTNLSGGSYFATASAYGYDQQWFDHKSSFQQANTITVVEEQTKGNINFDLQPASFGNAVTIAEARKDDNHDLIPDYSLTSDILVLHGVVTSPNLLAGVHFTSYYIQDSTSGINVFSSLPDITNFQIGDSAVVVGTIFQFRGLTEFRPLAMDSLHFGLLKHHAVLPKPKRVTLHEYALNAENYEGQLVEIDTLYKLVGAWPGVGSNATLYLINASKSDTTQMFLDWDTDIDGTTEPQYPINVIGIAEQYSSGTTVRNNGYGIEPRAATDIVHTTGILRVQDGFAGIPSTFELYNSYPNPFNPSTTIMYGLPQESRVSLKVYSVLGQEVSTLVNDVRNAGYHREMWNGKDSNGMQVSSGVYFFRMAAQSIEGKTQSFVQVKKMLLMK